jgi:hypothetical protein
MDSTVSDINETRVGACLKKKKSPNQLRIYGFSFLSIFKQHLLVCFPSITKNLKKAADWE